jgi:hypothetical protein
MNSEALILAAVILVSMTSIYLLISRDWRFSIGGLAVQFLGVFLLVNSSWPVELAVTKMVSGWMAGAILGIAIISGPDTWRESETSIKFGTTFRLLSATIIALTVTSLVLHSGDIFSAINPKIQWGGFFLIGIGLLQLSFTSHPLRVIIGLLTALSGFEILYAAIESSILVTGLLAGITLGLSLVGAYLLVAPYMEQTS